jgi:YVTN family beta-propeller protein
VAITPGGAFAYVTNTGSDKVSVIATATNTVVATVTVPLGSFPQGVAITPDAKILVTIDIKPGSDPNSINPKSKGVIPVAILTTSTFDATTVDPTTVRFGPTGTETTPVQSALKDVDGDGDTDMILHFVTQKTGLQCGDTSASLTGETLDGQMIQGSDAVKTAGCK